MTPAKETSGSRAKRIVLRSFRTNRIGLVNPIHTIQYIRSQVREASEMTVYTVPMQISCQAWSCAWFVDSIQVLLPILKGPLHPGQHPFPDETWLADASAAPQTGLNLRHDAAARPLCDGPKTTAKLWRVRRKLAYSGQHASLRGPYFGVAKRLTPRIRLPYVKNINLFT